MMGGALIPPSSTASMHSAMQNSFSSLVWWCGFAIFMVFRAIFFFHLGSADPLQTPSLAMPRQRMRPRRGSPWHPRRPRTSSSPSGSSTPGLDSLAVVDTSWSPAWLSPRVKHSSSPRHNLKTPPPTLPREHSAILQDLFFELREGVNDLQFRVQQMEGRLSVLLQLLATPPPAAPQYSHDASENSSGHASSLQHATTEESMPFAGKEGNPEDIHALARKATLASNEGGDDTAASAVAVEAKDSSIQVPEDKSHNATDMQWTIGGTPVIEEPWPGILPEYVPDYTILVPYSSSSDAHGS